MVELRWITFGKNRQLEYRILMPAVDASGALCPGVEWSGWHIVPSVDGEQAAFDDVVASGGIFPPDADETP